MFQKRFGRSLEFLWGTMRSQTAPRGTSGSLRGFRWNQQISGAFQENPSDCRGLPRDLRGASRGLRGSPWGPRRSEEGEGVSGVSESFEGLQKVLESFRSVLRNLGHFSGS